MTEYSLQVMSHIDPALVEEIDLTGPKKRRLSPRLRAAVIAACVCLALLGTVSAAGGLTGVFKGREIPMEVPELIGYSYQLSGIEAVPREAFRPEFWEAIEKKEDGKLAYLTREALEEDMGFRLAENSVLQQMFQGQCAIQKWSSGDRLSLWELYVEEGSVIRLKADIFFSIDTCDPSEFSPWNVYQGSFAEDPEHYDMPGGSTALVMTVTLPYGMDGREGYSYLYHSYFIWDGILYSVSIHAAPEQKEEVRALLEDILDAFYYT